MPLTSCNSDASGAEKKDVSSTTTTGKVEPLTDIFLQVDDTATAILKKKKKPNSLMYVSAPPLVPYIELLLTSAYSVTDAVNDDNSIIALSNNTMETLQLFRGDTVLVKGKKRKDTVLIVLADDDLDDGSARMNRVVRHNLRVKHGDIVTVHPCPDIKYVSRQTSPVR